MKYQHKRARVLLRLFFKMSRFYYEHQGNNYKWTRRACKPKPACCESRRSARPRNQVSQPPVRKGLASLLDPDVAALHARSEGAFYFAENVI